MLERLDRLDRDALEAARGRIATLSAEAGQFDDRLAERNRQFTADTALRFAAASDRHDAEVARLTGLFARIDADLAARRAAQEEQAQSLLTATGTMVERLDGMGERIAAIAAFGNQTEETLGANLRALGERLGASREALAGIDHSLEGLTDGAVRLLELIQASTEQSRDQLPAALSAGTARLEEWEGRARSLCDLVQSATGRGEDLSRVVAGTRETVAATLAEIAQLQDSVGNNTAGHAATLAALKQDLGELDRATLSSAEQAQGRLAQAITALNRAAQTAVSALGSDAEGAISALADRLGSESAGAIDRALRLRMAEAVGQLEQAAGHASGISREAAMQLRDQLAKVDELTGNLERRVSQARTRAEEQVDNDFARRVALITEALNSNAIDIAKALSTEVTDTAWAAYLKGDRGVFTRRAVRLIDPSEAREVVSIYENDHEFREHVNRYIHDFEAMLRQLLSTRDGHALGVTLLSSDMGKLYVVLAQAIERLRT